MTVEERRAYKKAWAQSNDVRRKGYANAWYRRNREAVSARLKVRRQNDPEFAERKRAYSRALRAAHPERAKIYQQRWWDKLTPEEREQVRLDACAQSQRYCKAHPEKARLATQKRKALKKAATVNLRGLNSFAKAVRAHKLATCYYCKKRVPSNGVHLDHIVPLSKGGAHSAENLCVACAHCNLTKHNKTLLEWAQDRAGQQILNL